MPISLGFWEWGCRHSTLIVINVGYILLQEPAYTVKYVILISSRFTFMYLSCICILYTGYYLVCLAHFPFQILLLETSVSKLEFMERVVLKCQLNLFRACEANFTEGNPSFQCYLTTVTGLVLDSRKHSHLCVQQGQINEMMSKRIHVHRTLKDVLITSIYMQKITK